MKFNKLFLLLLPLSLVACNNSKEPEKPDPSLLTTPLCMTCTSEIDGLINVYHSTIDPIEDFSLQYSRDNKAWYDVDFIYRQHTFILKKGETIYFRGDNPEGFNRASAGTGGGAPTPERLTMFAAASGAISIGGNVMSLLSSTDFDKLVDIPCDYCFGMLFYNYESYSLYADASKLSLPATKLKESCYADMFLNNPLLEYAPILSATDLATDCYLEMFYGCDNLKKLQVAFDETAFVKVDGIYPYTLNWLGKAGDFVTNDGEPIFIWPGDISGITRESSTVPEGWIIEQTPTEVF